MSTHVLTVPDCPRSVNDGGGGSRRHHMAAHKEKKHWQELFAVELMIAKVPKGMSFCAVDVKVRWKRRNHRDVTNYIHPVLKPFADALVKGGYLEDDDDQHFMLDGFSFEYPTEWPYANPRLKSEMVLRLEADYR